MSITSLTSDQLRKVREATGLSQEAFAEKIGVSTSVISMAESGRRNVTARVTQAIVRAFELTPDKLAEIERIHDRHETERRQFRL